ncbi:hypothetical protein J2Y69_001602 [Microbacterium resistens]|uniref:MarR family transcriptional regulator n=1 Tax=Microbacterium resistens TaxID=156977 RepID=A0ABU1SCN9_9MICO|nr:hypothetical protein [Microbacterium resistens]MDR6867003.1 hypothetical protein [Microbacterium resistens]
MNTDDTTPESLPTTEPAPTPGRPFGYWITAVDRLMAAELAAAFDREGITRRDWRLLNLVDGTVPSDRPLRGGKLRRIVQLGWVAREGEDWTLTDEGRAAKERLATIVDTIRARVASAVDPEEFAAMATALEKIARELGWHEGTRLPRSDRGRRHPFAGRPEHDRGHDPRTHGERGQEHDHEHGFHRHGPHGHGRCGQDRRGRDAFDGHRHEQDHRGHREQDRRGYDVPRGDRQEHPDRQGHHRPGPAAGWGHRGRPIHIHLRG